jgi:hypothetical protein
MIGRDEIQRLRLEHDRFMAEAQAEREAEANEVVYKETDNNALQYTPEPQPIPIMRASLHEMARPSPVPP